MKDGYAEAEKIERRVNELLEADPINKENGFEWLKFARTLGTTMSIIQEHARDLKVLNPKTGDDPAPTLSAIQRSLNRLRPSVSPSTRVDIESIAVCESCICQFCCNPEKLKICPEVCIPDDELGDKNCGPTGRCSEFCGDNQQHNRTMDIFAGRDELSLASVNENTSETKTGCDSVCNKCDNLDECKPCLNEDGTYGKFPEKK